ncbi:prolipoprotein diacylglyceryl transferase [Fulvivirga maritima]|uniref:prolipoprotein diacylglyceryl transferase n=1 Tax=Fulvivirga maritima TaxID=2904247 RepID=UPI001F3DA914|nr:prolipoprotein diacylglyceryl transferase [Fulvivirga maritima]UII29435.1 prolipoprotein diacylglyceryl transferase [Fulvivirga maritima]
MFNLSYIIWEPNPIFFHLPISEYPVRYYGILFTLGLIISQQILFYVFKKEGKPERDVESLTIYLLIATVVGARLGHVIFYDFLNNPEKIWQDPLYVFRVWEGGLASHGAAIGILLALWFYSRFQFRISPFKAKKLVFKKQKRPNQSFLQIVDRIAIVVALCGCFIRVGNFINSEIIGTPTHSDFGVVFVNNLNLFTQDDSSPIESISYVQNHLAPPIEPGYMPIDLTLNFKAHPDVQTEEGIESFLNGYFLTQLKSRSFLNEHFYYPPSTELSPLISKTSTGEYEATIIVYGIVRHPAQLYEAFSCLVLFFILFGIWNKKRLNTPPGLLFGILLMVVFSLRFLYEFIKENQLSFENKLMLNMGQTLSIPLIISGVIILIYALRKDKQKN